MRLTRAISSRRAANPRAGVRSQRSAAPSPTAVVSTAVALFASALASTAAAETIFSDGFESGAVCAWTISTPVASLAVASSPRVGQPPATIAGLVVPSHLRRPAARYAATNPDDLRQIWRTATPGPERIEKRHAVSGELPARGGSPTQLGHADPATGLTTSFDGADFDVSAGQNCGQYFVPPNPSAAAGTQQLVDVVSSVVEFFDKDGSRTFIAPLRSFFAGLSPHSAPFDARVVYDAFSNRFVIASLDKTDTSTGDPYNSSRILLAVSDDGDPAGTWYLTAIDALTPVDGVDRWADSIGLALDNQAIYITANLFQFGECDPPCVSYGGSRLWIVGQDPFYSGGEASVSVFDPYAQSPTDATSTQPAMMMDAPLENMGTYLTSYGPFTNGAAEYLQVVLMKDPLGTPTFTTSFFSLGAADDTTEPLPGAPQLGTSRLLDAGDRRTRSAAWGNSYLATTLTVLPPTGPNAGQPTALWVQLFAPGGLTGSDNWGQLSGATLAPGIHTGRAAVGINHSGSLFFGFAATAPGIYPGAYWTVKSLLPIADPVPLQAGEDSYVRTLGDPVHDPNPWGSDSAVAIDPVDASGWIFGEYAMTRGTVTQIPPYASEDGRWATRWGRVTEPLQIILSNGTTLETGSPASVSGAGFTAGSVIDLSVSSSDGMIAYGPFTPTSITPTVLRWSVPSSIPLGYGFMTLAVTNSDQDSRTSNTVCENLVGPPNQSPPTIFSINGPSVAAPDCSIPYNRINTVLVPGSTCKVRTGGAIQPQAHVVTATSDSGALPMSGGSNSWSFVVPSNTPSGPATVYLVTSPYTGNVVSNAVSLTIGTAATSR